MVAAVRKPLNYLAPEYDYGFPFPGGKKLSGFYEHWPASGGSHTRCRMKDWMKFYDEECEIRRLHAESLDAR
jgi:hypothetical protein